MAVPRMHLLHQAIATEGVGAAELYWLVQKIPTDIARECSSLSGGGSGVKLANDRLMLVPWKRGTWCIMMRTSCTSALVPNGSGLGPVCGGLPRYFPFFGRPPFALVS